MCKRTAFFTHDPYSKGKPTEVVSLEDSHARFACVEGSSASSEKVCLHLTFQGKTLIRGNAEVPVPKRVNVFCGNVSSLWEAAELKSAVDTFCDAEPLRDPRKGTNTPYVGGLRLGGYHPVCPLERQNAAPLPLLPLSDREMDRSST